MLHGGLCLDYLIAPERVQFTSGGADQGVSVTTRHLQPATVLAVHATLLKVMSGVEPHDWGSMAQIMPVKLWHTPLPACRSTAPQPHCPPA